MGHLNEETFKIPAIADLRLFTLIEYFRPEVGVRNNQIMVLISFSIRKT